MTGYYLFLIFVMCSQHRVECADSDDSILNHDRIAVNTTKDDDAKVQILDDFHRVCGVICSCSFNELRNLSVICDNRKLTAIPNHLPMGTTILIYSGNDVVNNTVTREFLFPAKIKHVIHLDLSYNGIEKITSDAFEEFDALRVLSLSGNKLKLIGTSFLHPIQQTLIRIYADNVKSQYLWDMFTTSQNAPKTCNDVIDLPRFQFLHLNDNQLDKLNTFIVTCLACGKDKLTLFLRNNSFDNLSIQKVYTGIRNQTSSCNISSMAPSNSVLTLDVTWNKIKKLDDVTLGKLSRQNAFEFQIFAGKNPIMCECEVGDLEAYLHTEESYHVIMDRQHLTCETPKILKGIKISDLDGLHINYCSGEWTDRFSLRTSQLIFIIICTTTLLFVSISVAYLNRGKCLVHCGVICNGEEDNFWVSKHQDKYSIPKSYTGVNSNYSIEASTTVM